MNITAKMSAAALTALVAVASEAKVEEEYSAEWDTNVSSNSEGTAEIVASSSHEERKFKHQEILNYQLDRNNVDGSVEEEMLTDGECKLESVSVNVTGRSKRDEVEEMFLKKIKEV